MDKGKRKEGEYTKVSTGVSDGDTESSDRAEGASEDRPLVAKSAAIKNRRKDKEEETATMPVILVTNPPSPVPPDTGTSCSSSKTHPANDAEATSGGGVSVNVIPTLPSETPVVEDLSVSPVGPQPILLGTPTSPRVPTSPRSPRRTTEQTEHHHHHHSRKSSKCESEQGQHSSQMPTQNGPENTQTPSSATLCQMAIHPETGVAIKPHLVYNLQPTLLPPVSGGRVCSLLVVEGVIWVGGTEGSISLWNSQNLEPLNTIAVHKSRIYAMVNVRSKVFVSSEQGAVWSVNTKSFKLKKYAVHDTEHSFVRCLVVNESPGIEPEIWSCAPASNSSQIAIMTDSGKVKGRIIVNQVINSIAFLGNHVWLGCFDLVRIISTSSEEGGSSHVEEVPLHTSCRVGALQPVGFNMLVGCGSSVIVMNSEGKELMKLAHQKEVTRLSLFQNLVLSSDLSGAVTCWDPANQFPKVHEFHFPPPSFAAQSSDTGVSGSPGASGSVSGSSFLSQTALGGSGTAPTTSTTTSRSVRSSSGSGTPAPSHANSGDIGRTPRLGIKTLVSFYWQDTPSFLAGNTDNALCLWRAPKF
ncbi:hypothetical protein Pelo_4562 [Pelomyxa schiedti]|nr:hypothetical protein Pelo_4562 [Pelomyxa schiedti]